MDPSKPSTSDSKENEINPTDASSSVDATPKVETAPPSDSSPMPDAIPTTTADSSMDAPTTGMPVMGTATTVPPKKKGLMVGLIAAAAIIVLGGGGAAAYFGYIVPNKPENILKTALGNFLSGKATSEYIDGSLDITSKSDNQTFTTAFTGKENNQGALELSASADLGVTKATFDARSVDGGSIYLKVGGLEGLPELLEASGVSGATTYAPLVATVNNQWYEINNSVLKQMGLDLSSKMNAADQQKLVDLYAQHPFLTIKQRLANEQIKGMDSYHVQVTLNKASLQSYLQGVSDANLTSFKDAKEALKQLKTSLGSSSVDFSKYPLDVWVTKKDKMIDQIKFTGSNNDLTAVFRMTFYDFNKAVTVEKPAGAKSILELLGELFGGNSSDGQAVLNQLQKSGGVPL